MPSQLRILALLVIMQIPVVAQPQQESVPQTPSEAYERANEPVREWSKSTNPTLEGNIKANKQQEQLAKKYCDLFTLGKWKGEELLSLGLLYGLARQHENAENALKAYLREPNVQKKTPAIKQLLYNLTAQEKWDGAIPITSLLLDEPIYDQDIIFITQSVIDGIRATDLKQAIKLSEKRLPKLVSYAEANAKSPGHAALVLDRALEMGAMYREYGDVEKSEQFYKWFLSKFNAGPLVSEKRVKDSVEAAIRRAHLVGGDAPAIEAIEYIDMQKLNISDLKGKIVLLDFLAHWCAPCIASFPDLELLKKKYEASGLVILGVTSYYGFFGNREKLDNSEELAKLKSLKEKHQVKFGFIIGPRNNETRYGIAGLPAYALIDRSGRIRYLEQGPDKQQLEKAIQKLIAEPASNK